MDKANEAWNIHFKHVDVKWKLETSEKRFLAARYWICRECQLATEQGQTFLWLQSLGKVWNIIIREWLVGRVSPFYTFTKDNCRAQVSFWLQVSWTNYLFMRRTFKYPKITTIPEVRICCNAWVVHNMCNLEWILNQYNPKSLLKEGWLNIYL